LVEQAAKRSRLQKASSDRDFLGKIQEFDNTAFQDSTKKRSEEELNIIRYITTGAAWARNKLHEIGKAEDDRCQLCGDKEEDIRHSLWECRCIHGEDTERMRALRHLLPVNLQFGIPAPITKDLDKTYWGATFDDIKNQNFDFTVLCGIAGNTKERRRMGNKNATAELSFKDKDIDTTGRNPRQIFQQLKGNSMKAEEFTKISWCEAEPPDDINVYSDGSFKNPRRPIYSLAGAGIWWPNRKLENDPLSRSETEMSLERQESGGAALRAWLAGFGGSSTRAELAAGIVALQYIGPVHLGTDSQAFLSKAMMLRDMAKKGKKPRRPWNTQRDGDLWEIFDTALIDKNPLSFKASKVKGHATDDMVKEQKVRQADKDGNDAADRIAEEGIQHFGKDIIRASAEFAKRHIGYGKFLKKLHNSFIETIITKNEKIQAIEKLKHPIDAVTKKKMVVLNKAVIPQYGDIARTWNTSMINIKNFKGVLETHTKAEEIQKFIKGMTFQKCIAGEQGISWIELYILYKLQGGRCPVEELPNKAEKRPALRTQLKQFRATCRIIARHTMSQEDAINFKPSTYAKPRLQGLGVDNHMAMISCNVCINDELKRKIAFHILRIQTGRTIKITNRILDGDVSIPTARINLQKRCAWSKTIGTHKGEMFKPFAGSASVAETKDEPEKEGTKVKEYFNLECHVCHTEVKADRPAFKSHQLDKKTWCRKCEKNFEVKTWLCSCGNAWFRCAIHKHYAYPESKPRPTPRPKSALDKSEQVDFSVQRKSKADHVREQQRAFTVKPNFLSPSLKRKFSHLFPQGASAG
jgi:ribonuclease HI